MKNLFLTTALSFPLLVQPAFAQTQMPMRDTSLTPASDASLINDEIIVTALRREQPAQDVGVALTAFTGDTLQDLGVRGVNSLENFAPSLEIENQFGGGQPSFSIRGVGFRDYATLNAPTVGIYVDDVAFPIPAMTQGVLFDMERVEVLRGPQGTLYGRNTTGGAIKIVSAKPTDEFAAGLLLEGGRFGLVEAEGFVSGSVAPAVRLRVSGATAQGGDWQTNRETGEEIGAAERYALRGITQIDLSSNWMAEVNLHGFIDDSDGLGLQLFNDSAFGPLAHEGRRSTSFGSSDEFSMLVGFPTDQRPFRNNEGWGTSLTLTGALGAVDVTYIGAYETLNRQEFNDFDALSIGGAGVYFETSADVMSHEIRAAGEALEERLRWIGGLFYSREDLNELYQSDFVASFGPGFAVTTPYDQDVETAAIFANVDVDLTDQLTLVGGLRYEDESRDLNNLGTFATGFGLFNFANGTVDGTLENRSLDSDNLSGKIGLDYRPTDNFLVYGSYSRGVKSGGFTAYNTLNPNALDPFQPEKLDAFEVGFKSDFANDTVRLNGSLFYYDYSNQQVQSAIFDPGTGAIVGRIVNAPKSEIWGGEVELLWQVAKGLTLGQTLGYKEGEFTEFSDLDTAATGASGSAVFVDRAGQALGFPEVSYQGFVKAERTIATGWRGNAQFDYSYRDDLSLPLLGDAYRVDSYWLANAQIGIAPESGIWELSLWARNLFNADFDETRNFFIAPGGVADVAAPGRPVTYGVRLTLRN